MDCPPNNARHAQITGSKPWYELAGQAANQIDLGRNSNQIEPRVISARRSLDAGLRRVAMKIMKTFSSAKSTNSPQSKQVRSDQSSSHIFGLAATAVFFVMLILNAVSYQ
jgi:hypothetical protein